MNALLKEIRRNPMLWLLVFVPVVFAAAKLKPEAHTVLFVILRLLVILRLVRWLIARTRLPAHAVSAPTLSGQRLDEGELLNAATVVLLFLVVSVASCLPFLFYGYAPLEALFEVASATGTVGLSVGVAGPDLEPGLKGVLCADMLLGRLEVFAVLVALSPRTWIGRRIAS